MKNLDDIIYLLEIFIEEDDQKALENALSQVQKNRFNINDLLLHLENFKGDVQRKKRAIMLVRKKMGLSIIPGPVCRSS